jgi:hypothetical protein
MQHPIRTIPGATLWQPQWPPGSRLTPRILCVLAVLLGSPADSVFAGSKNNIGSKEAAAQSETSVANDVELQWAENGSFQTLTGNPQPESLLIRSVGELRSDATWNFVVAHGLGGTVPDDRFCQLALEIKRINPAANVLLLDWSSTATLTNYGIPRVWHIAGCLNAIAAEAASGLSSLKIDSKQTTLIGESFGVYIQGHVAKSLGGVTNILAFNPASEAGGCEPVNLCNASQRAWSFHTFCVYDTTRQIAHADFLLETPEEASHLAQHTHGIQWLTRLLRAGDSSWLMLNKSVPPACTEAFGGIALEDGEFIPSAIPRIRQSVAAQSTALENSSTESLIASVRMEGRSK